MSGITAGLVALVLAYSAPVAVQEPPPLPAGVHECDIDLERVGQMEDILSNALMRGLGFESSRVRDYLTRTRRDCADGRELLARTATEFGLKETDLSAEVERFRHINCDPEAAVTDDVVGAPADGPALPLTQFAQDVTLHVVLHELGHALIREFDLPVLGNEETMADAFATHYLTTHMPERALDVLLARVSSLMFEAGEVPRAEWDVDGEHDNDARRACQIAALAVAADPQKYAPVAAAAGLSEENVRKATDYGTEIQRSWRRILEPLWMPAGLASSEARVEIEGRGRPLDELRTSGLAAELEAQLRRFDWHSQVAIRFVEGDGRAGWSRSARAVTVHDAYVRRFISQGASLARSR